MSIRTVTQSLLQFELKWAEKPQGVVYVLGSNNKNKLQNEVKSIVDSHAHDFQIKKLLESDKRYIHFVGRSGPVWILKNSELQKGQHQGLLDESAYGWFRDHAGVVLTSSKSLSVENIQVYFSQIKTDEISRAVIVGFEMAAYNFFNIYSQKKTTTSKIFLQSDLFKLSKKSIDEAIAESICIQLARHLINLPPNQIDPHTVEELVTKHLKFPNTKIIVWDEEKMAEENMNLHLAVGAGSGTPPRMIHLKYRPKKVTNKKPIAFVGKGITFDTGGLDLKPSSGMRLMKKDMGGAAAVLALAYWVAQSGYGRACDFYLALAENSVDAFSMRPSDLYKSRAGYIVEIDNTDAEGRLVLADVLDVAITQKGKDEPEVVVDIATLTGAIKVALGADMAGLFSNDDKLAEQIEKAGQQAGDPAWRMPLIQKYFSTLNSNFADFKNSGEGFGGAITAALFLEKFCGGKKWAHLDIYSWTDKSTGALASAGGSGQAVQMMIQWLKSVG
ncbi:MAG: leucyl aminopeptidase family protein [Pseudobdellovibrio sp.]